MLGTYAISGLYYLLPPQRDVRDKLPHQSKFYLPATRSARFS